MKLHLGVVEQPYSDASDAERYHHAMKKAMGEGFTKHVTTGDVASFLEARYHPMEIYLHLHGQAVADAVAESMAGALESLAMGAPPSINPFGTAMGKIEEGFKAMLSSGELESLGYPGLPTKAAQQRRSGRFKNKKAPKVRPSLIDTGLYQSSFKSWVEGSPEGDR